MNYQQAKLRSDILKALAHPARIMLVHALTEDDKCVCELNALLPMDQSNISRHLAQLKRTGIITEYKTGPKVFHHLECPCILKAFDCALEVLESSAKRQNAVLA